MIFGCKNLCKSYADRVILQDVTLTLSEGSVTCLMAPSGVGKTTLFRLFAGLERPDSGTLLGFDRARVSMVFQEDRLCEHLSPVTNVAMVQTAPDRRALEGVLSAILPAECLHQPVSQLSGGMKRRVAIARAMLHSSDVLLLDEPFTGLDEENRERVMRFVLEHQDGRPLLFTSHQSEEARLMGAQLIHL